MGHYRKPLRKQKGAVFSIPNCFLPQWGGKTITECPKDYKIFSQGDPADAVFYIQQGRVKLKVKSNRAKKRSSQS